jgi:hypothetical protein
MPETYQDIAPALMKELKRQLKSLMASQEEQKFRSVEHALNGQMKAFSVAKLAAMTALASCKELTEPIEWLSQARDLALPEIVRISHSSEYSEIIETSDFEVEARVPDLSADPRQLRDSIRCRFSAGVIEYEANDGYGSLVRHSGKLRYEMPKWEARIHKYAVQIQLQDEFKKNPLADFRSALREIVRKGKKVRLYVDGAKVLGQLEGAYKNKDGNFVVSMLDGPTLRFQPLGYAVEVKSGIWWVNMNNDGWQLFLDPTK